MKIPVRGVLAALCAATAIAACGGKSDDELISSAKSYLAKGDEKAAIIQLKNVLANKPEQAEARFLLGKALLRDDLPTLAVLELGKALELGHAKSQTIPLLAKAMSGAGQSRKLIEQFAETSFDDPAATAELKLALATAYAQQGDEAKATAAAREAIAKAPDLPAVQVTQARMLTAEGKLDESLALLSRVTQADPNNAEAWFHTGDALLRARGDVKGALQALDKAIAAQPKYMAAHSTAIGLLLTQGDTKTAAARLDQMRKLWPKNHPQLLYLDAQVAVASGDNKRARDLSQELLKMAPEDLRALQLAGATAFKVGALLEAERALTKALGDDPNLPSARRLLAQTYLRGGQPAKALSALQPLLAAGEPDGAALALAAEAYLQTGDAARAEEFYARAVKQNPKDARSRAALALTRMSSSGLQTTVENLESIASSDSGVVAEYALVGVHMRNGEFDKALKTIDAIEAKQPGKPLPAQMRGSIFLRKNDLVQARRSFEKAVEIDPVYLPAVSLLAQLDLAEKKPEQARKRFEEVLKHDPKNLQALLALAGMRQKEGGSKEEMATLLGNAVRQNPSEPEPRLLLIDMYLSREDPKAALIAAQEAVAALPERADLLAALGRAQYAAGENLQAVTSLEKAAGMSPNQAGPLLQLTQAYLLQKNFAAAAQTARRAVQAAPNMLATHQARVEVELAAQRPQEALNITRELQKQRPDDAAGFMLEAAVEASRKNPGAAADAYRNALKRSPTGALASLAHGALMAAGRKAEADKLEASWLAEHPRDTAFLLHLGLQALEQGALEKAEARMRSVTQLDPQSAVAFNNLSWVLAERKQPGAVAAAQRANELRPNMPEFLDTLAHALGAEGQMDKAIETQKKALDLAGPNAPVLRLNLAKLYVKKGDAAAARNELQTLTALGSKFGQQDEVARLMKSL